MSPHELEFPSVLEWNRLSEISHLVKRTECILEQRISDLFAQGEVVRSNENLELLAEFRQALNAGAIRVAEPIDGAWKLNTWVKKGLLLHPGARRIARDRR